MIMGRKKFCILTTQRSGSAWLKTLLNNHPKVKCFGEVFLYRGPKGGKYSDPHYLRYYDFKKRENIVRPWSVFKYMDSFFDDYPGEYEAIGFKLMYNQLFARPEICLSLLKHKYKIIHLIRENYLDRILSCEGQKQLSNPHPTTNVTISPIYLEPSSLVSKLNTMDFRVRSFRGILKMYFLGSMEVMYKDLCTQTDFTVDSLLKYIGCQSTPTGNYSSPLKKIIKGNYKEKILNYAEVKEVLNSSKYSKFLGN